MDSMKFNTLNMKKMYLSVCLMMATMVGLAQVPQAFSYQAVIRDSNNVLLMNQMVGEKISLVKDSVGGTVVYSELHSVKTNANGLISLQIGTGNILTGSFSGIDWSSGVYFIRTETDPKGGSSYTISNTSQLLSVPYALQAGSAPIRTLKYPDGLENSQTVIIKPGSSYNVPKGKNIYFPDYDGYTSDNNDSFMVWGLTNSISIFGENHVIKNKNSVAIQGFIINKRINPFSYHLLQGPFTVPQNRFLVITTTFSDPFFAYPSDIIINGNSYQTFQAEPGFFPLVLKPGTVIEGVDIINGYWQ